MNFSKSPVALVLLLICTVSICVCVCVCVCVCLFRQLAAAPEDESSSATLLPWSVHISCPIVLLTFLSIGHTVSLCYFSPVWRRSIVISLSVCLHVCLSACMSRRYDVQTLRNFLYMFMWSWLGPPVTTVQYVMYFRFCGWRHVFT